MKRRGGEIRRPLPLVPSLRIRNRRTLSWTRLSSPTARPAHAPPLLRHPDRAPVAHREPPRRSRYPTGCFVFCVPGTGQKVSCVSVWCPLLDFCVSYLHSTTQTRCMHHKVPRLCLSCLFSVSCVPRAALKCLWPAPGVRRAETCSRRPTGDDILLPRRAAHARTSTSAGKSPAC